MNRIYLLVTLLIVMAGSASAQSTDLKLLSNIKAGDTIKWDKNGNSGRIIIWGFVNAGPTALVQAMDTIVLKRAYSSNGQQSIKLILPPAGVKVGDTVTFRDTVHFKFTTAAPQPNNPYNWCDSVWVKHGASAMSDPNIGLGNNKLCANIIFKEVILPASVGNVTANANGLNIYPNPASGMVNFTYTFNVNTQASITVRDMTGKAVYSEDLGKNSGERSFPINISGLSAGLYMIELNADNNKIVSKFTVQ